MYARIELGRSTCRSPCRLNAHGPRQILLPLGKKSLETGWPNEIFHYKLRVTVRDKVKAMIRIAKRLMRCHTILTPITHTLIQ